MRFARWFLASACALAATGQLALTPATAADEAASPGETVIATVDGAAITLADLNRFIERLPERARDYARTRKAEMLQALIHRRLMFRYAEGSGLAESERVKQELASARREVLIREAVREIHAAAQPSEAELRAQYDQFTAKYRVGERVTAAHIMVATKEEAEALLTELREGGDFTALAKERSLAPERGRGGSLGTMQRGTHRRTGLPEIIEDTAFSLPPGAYSDVVQSGYGWHVVHTSERDEGRQLSFDEARSQIEESLGEEKRGAALQGTLKKLTERYTVESFPDRIQ